MTASDSTGSASAAPRETSAARWWFYGKVALSLLFLAYLAFSVEWPKVWTAARAASPGWLVLSLINIPAGTLLVAARYHCQINRLTSLPTMIHLVIFQGSISTFVANAAGSLSLIGILVKVHKVPAALAVQATIITRVGDLTASMVAVAILATLIWDRLEKLHSLIFTAMLLAAAALALATAVVIIGRRLPLVPSSGASVAGGRWRKLLDLGVALLHLEPGYLRAVLPRTLLHSFALQAVVAVTMYLGAQAFHLEVGFPEAAFVGVVSTFISSLPITVFGGLGVYEISTVGLLAIFGVPIEASAGMVLVLRAIFFIVMAVAFFVVRPPVR